MLGAPKLITAEQRRQLGVPQSGMAVEILMATPILPALRTAVMVFVKFHDKIKHLLVPWRTT